MQDVKNEIKVGFLVIVATLLLISFAWVLDVKSPFQRPHRFYLLYRFAGGIEVGSPVRLSGIKIGTVDKIEFFPERLPDNPSGDEDRIMTPLRLSISIDKNAAFGVRTDSQFYINLAGIIGERYIEITPGKHNSPVLAAGATAIGIDPPRIDQMISQSFNLAGKIQEIIESNKGDITKSIELLYKLSSNINGILGKAEKSKILHTDLPMLLSEAIETMGEIKKIVTKANSHETAKILALLQELLLRLEPLKKEKVIQFFQKEGIRVRMF